MANEFFWGAATSAHQVEGGNNNDWTEWEYANSARLAAEAARRNANARVRIPDFILKNYPNPLREENYISGRACDHYNRFEEDFDIAKSLGHNAHRFSIEWSRIEPEEGKFNEKEINHYKDAISALRARGLEPFVTLYHWTLPIWVSNQGGWKNKKTIRDFPNFIEKIAKSIPEVKFWIILNEPLVYARQSFLKGLWPPQQKGFLSYFVVVRRLISAHKRAYAIIKSINPEARVGIAHNMSYFNPHGNKIINKILAALGAWQKNFYFLNTIKNSLDFIGLNYYSQYLVNLGFKEEKAGKVSDMGWGIIPEGIYRVLTALRKYNVPVYITENGLADARDTQRAAFIKEHIRWIKKAMDEGVDVRGYFHWSLLDNFEWSDGFWPRFGLVEVDYKTLARKIRPSAFVYKKTIENSAPTSAPDAGL